MRTPERMPRGQADLDFLRPNSFADASVLSPLVVADGRGRGRRAEPFRFLQDEARSAASGSGFANGQSGPQRRRQTLRRRIRWRRTACRAVESRSRQAQQSQQAFERSEGVHKVKSNLRSAALPSPARTTRLAGVSGDRNRLTDALLTHYNPQWRPPSSNGRGTPVPHPHRSPGQEGLCGHDKRLAWVKLAYQNLTMSCLCFPGRPRRVTTSCRRTSGGQSTESPRDPSSR